MGVRAPHSIGFTSSQVLGVHLWQSIVTAVAGVAVGGSVGFIVGRAIDRELISNVGAIAHTMLPGAVWVVAICSVGSCLCAGIVAGALALRSGPGRVLRVE